MNVIMLLESASRMWRQQQQQQVLHKKKNLHECVNTEKSIIRRIETSCWKETDLTGETIQSVIIAVLIFFFFFFF